MLHGDKCCGKSSIISKAAMLAEKWVHDSSTSDMTRKDVFVLLRSVTVMIVMATVKPFVFLHKHWRKFYILLINKFFSLLITLK